MQRTIDPSNNHLLENLLGDEAKETTSAPASTNKHTKQHSVFRRFFAFPFRITKQVQNLGIDKVQTVSALCCIVYFVVSIRSRFGLAITAHDATIWLNGLGIVLNIISGIILLPEIFGTHRLRQFQQLISRSSINTRLYIYRARRKILPRYKDFHNNIRYNWLGTFIIVFFSLGIVHAALIKAFHIFVILAIPFWLVAIYSFVFQRTKTIRTELLFVLIAPVILTLAFPILFVFLPVFVLGTITVNEILRAIIDEIEVRGQFQGFMLRTGIVIFLIGNVLQLIANFL